MADALERTKPPFEARFARAPPPETSAQEAATRVYNRGGIFTRSDPHVKPLDRNGNSFQATKWAPEKTAAAPPASPERLPRSLQRARGTVDPVDLFREKVLARGGSGGIQSLGRIFRIMDKDRNRRVGVEELSRVLQHYGMPLPEDEVKDLIAAIDKDNSGSLVYDEFLVAIRGQINSRRQKMIDMAYKVLDRTGDGKITVDDIRIAYNVDHHPDVLAGRLSPEEALEDFLSMYDSVDKDGTITGQEFTEYYRNVSASIFDDDYFELMIRNAWHIPGGEGWCANTANTRLLVVFKDGAQKVVMIENDLGLDLKDHAAVLAALQAQGVTNIAKFTLSGDV